MILAAARALKRTAAAILRAPLAAVLPLPCPARRAYNWDMETWDTIRARRNVRQYTDQRREELAHFDHKRPGRAAHYENRFLR